jgi:Cu-Zn family superoxide dismutase
MTTMLRLTTVAVCALLFATVGSLRPALTQSAPTFAAYIYDTTGKQLGQATFIGVDNGVQVRVDVTGLPPGKHGMHIHEVGSCNPLRDTQGKATPFGAAGGHFDPQGTSHHLGPYGSGHGGDMPNLVVSDAGHARTTFFDDRLSVAAGPMNIVGRAIVIHANEDNYTDTPPNGGSGGRIACGEIGPLRVSLEGMKTVQPSIVIADLHITAKRVVMGFKTRLAHLEGNVRVEDRNGNLIVAGEIVDLNLTTHEFTLVEPSTP